MNETRIEEPFIIDPLGYQLANPEPEEPLDDDRRTTKFGKHHGGTEALMMYATQSVISIVLLGCMVTACFVARDASSFAIVAVMVSFVGAATIAGLTLVLLYLKFRYVMLCTAGFLLVVAIGIVLANGFYALQ